MNPEEFRLVVASGPTREWLDPVRFISNPSTGQTGWSLATAAVGRFRDVVFISGPGSERFRTVEGASNVLVETTAEMTSAVRDHIRDSCLLIMSAAPADYTPTEASDQKIKKVAGEPYTLTLSPTTDILKSLIPLAAGWSAFYRVGFAAETRNLEEYARKKLAEKDLDFICANQVYKSEAGFGDHPNTLLVIDKKGETSKIGPATKDDLAVRLLDHIVAQIPAKNRAVI
ncbi:MAG: phosphopantothenoylcysteine decarboxylase [bacterium]|nr:phosphopantothenoylcysteine decarboxylase [bacterium]